jgi:hypothetical protein
VVGEGVVATQDRGWLEGEDAVVVAAPDEVAGDRGRARARLIQMPLPITTFPSTR